MVKARYTWFQKFLAFVWMFGTLSLFIGFSAASSSTYREMDAKLGLLFKPIGENTKYISQKFTQALFQGVKVEAIPVEVVFNYEVIIAELIQNVVNSIVDGIYKILDTLITAIEDLVNSLTGLRLNLNSVRATVALQGYALKKKLNGDIGDWLKENFGGGEASGSELHEKFFGEVKKFSQTVVAAGTLPTSQDPNIPTIAVPNEQEVQKQIKNISKSVAKVACIGDGPLLWKQVVGATVNSGCQLEVEAESFAEMKNRVEESKQARDKIYEDIKAGAPADCKDYLRTEVDDVITGSTGDDLFSQDDVITGSTGDDLIEKFADGTKTERLSNSACAATGDLSAQTALASAQVTQNGTGGNTVVINLNTIIVNFLTKIFKKVIDTLVIKPVIDAINKFKSSVPNFVSSAISKIGNTLSEIDPQLGSAANKILDAANNDVNALINNPTN